MTPEAKVKNKIKKFLDKLGCYYFFPQTGGYGRSGVPDIIICHQGKFIAIECKAGKGVLTALQKNNIDRINSNGGLAIVINESNIELLLTLVKEKV
jgi:Holliday junction resolvase